MNNRGYITLVSVVVVGAIGAAIATTLLLLGLTISRTAFVRVQSAQAQGVVSACVEEALQQIHDSTPYTGSGALIIGGGTCEYTVTSQGGQDRTVTALGIVGTIVRKITISITKVSPTITISSWQEVADL